MFSNAFIAFVVGACLGLVIASGLVTWAHLRDTTKKKDALLDAIDTELAGLRAEQDRLRSDIRRWKRRCGDQ